MLAHCCSGTAASKEEKPTDDEKAEEKKLLTTLLPIILPFVEDDSEGTLQLEVLFALQALCEDTGHKSGACRRRPCAVPCKAIISRRRPNCRHVPSRRAGPIQRRRRLRGRRLLCVAGRYRRGGEFQTNHARVKSASPRC